MTNRILIVGLTLAVGLLAGCKKSGDSAKAAPTPPPEPVATVDDYKNAYPKSAKSVFGAWRVPVQVSGEESVRYTFFFGKDKAGLLTECTSKDGQRRASAFVETKVEVTSGKISFLEPQSITNEQNQVECEASLGEEIHALKYSLHEDQLKLEGQPEPLERAY